MNARRPFMLEEWRVEPERCRVVKGETEARLEPRNMDLLVFLAEHAGQVLSRETLERAVWRDAVVGYDALTNAVNKLRRTLGDDSRRPRLIETIPKRGYRLIAGVAEVAPTAAGTPATRPAAAARRRRPSRSGALVALALLAVAAAAIAWWPFERRGVPAAGDGGAGAIDTSTPRRIAVLPFANLDPDDRYVHINEGLTEDIITDLSRLSGLFVIAHQSTRRYRESELDVARISADLKVRYLLVGSVRTDRERIRVNAQLVDSVRGVHLWADRYDYALVDLFALQDAVTRRIVEALAVTLSERESERIGRPGTHSLAAYDAFYRGQKLFRHRTEEDNRRAREAYRESILLDPGFARPYGTMAVALVTDYVRRWTDSPVETLLRAEEYARRAVELDDSSLSLWALAYVHVYRKKYREAVEIIERAIADDPNFGDGHGLLGLVKNILGEAEAAERHVRRGMELNPFYTWDYAYNLGRALYTQGRYAEAVVELEDAVQRNPNTPFAKLVLAASYLHLGRRDDAEWQVQEVFGIDPDWDWDAVSTWVSYADPAKLAAFRDDLRRLGLPD